MSYIKSQAFPGKGSVIAHSDDGSPEVWTKCGEVKNIVPSGAKTDSYDATNMESGYSKEYKPSGLIDWGSVKITLNNVPSDAVRAILAADFEAGAIHKWGVKYPLSSIVGGSNTVPEYVEFDAFITDYDDLGDLDTTKLSEYSFSLQRTGPPTVTPEGTATAPF